MEKTPPHSSVIQCIRNIPYSIGALSLNSSRVTSKSALALSSEVLKWLLPDQEDLSLGYELLLVFP